MKERGGDQVEIKDVKKKCKHCGRFNTYPLILEIHDPEIFYGAVEELGDMIHSMMGHLRKYLLKFIPTDEGDEKWKIKVEEMLDE